MASNEELLLELRGLKQRVAEIEQQLCSRTGDGDASSSISKNNLHSTAGQGIVAGSTGKHSTIKRWHNSNTLQ
jgi:hypothetical protein